MDRESKTPTVIVCDPSKETGKLKRIGGSSSDTWNTALADQTISSIWLGHSDKAERQKLFGATVAALVGICPNDEIDGMLAAQINDRLSPRFDGMLPAGDDQRSDPAIC